MKLFRYVLVAALAAEPALTFAQTAAPARANNPIVKRDLNQQRRIGNGIQNGRLTPQQGARLERQQTRIHRQVRNMRTRNNGRLTMKDRSTIRHRQNVASRRIYRAKDTTHRKG
jgi:hypothetical protein